MRFLKIDKFNQPIYRFFTPSSEPNIEGEGITLCSLAWWRQDIPKDIKERFPNPVVLTGSQEEAEYFKNNFDVDVLWCNHNAFLNENIYTIDNSIEKKYDMVVSSCFNHYKRLHLSKLINNTVHLGYPNGHTAHLGFTNGSFEYVPDWGTRPNFTNNSILAEDWKWLGHLDIVKHMNSARVGGIFSAREGACFSSSEYLLCGLPVVSTKSEGGRDIWYNNTNSIICEDDPTSVKKCTDDAIKLLNSHIFNPQKIREMHLKQMDEIRNKLTTYVKEKLDDYGENKNTDFNQLKYWLSYHDDTNSYCL